MKKVVLLSILIALCFNLNVFAEEKIKVVVDENTLNLDVSPIIVDGRTLVPLRAIFEALGAQVEWESTTKTITGTKGDSKIVLTIDSTNAIVNNLSKTLDVPAKIINGRTLVPIRFISESLSCKVNWDSITRTVSVNSYLTELAEEYTEFKLANFKIKLPPKWTSTEEVQDEYVTNVNVIPDAEEMPLFKIISMKNANKLSLEDAVNTYLNPMVAQFQNGLLTKTTKSLRSEIILADNPAILHELSGEMTFSDAASKVQAYLMLTMDGERIYIESIVCKDPYLTQKSDLMKRALMSLIPILQTN